jgi:hypothetical protein
MKHKILLTIIILFALGLTACEDAYSGTMILGGNHTYQAGETLSGELVIVSGTVLLEGGAYLAGSIYMLGGNLDINGEIAGDLSIIGGNGLLGPQARVGGNVNLAGGRLERSPSALIAGTLREASDLSLDAETIFPKRSPENRLIWVIPQALGMAFLGYAANRFFPHPVSRVGKAVFEHPLVAGAVGLLCGLVLPALLVLMAFTVILIPVSIIGLITIGLILIYGWIGAGSIVGKWLSRRTRHKLPPSQTTFLGTLVFMLAMQALGFIPLIGPTLTLIVTLIVAGAVLITRFGTQTFVPAIDRELPEVEISV